MVSVWLSAPTELSTWLTTTVAVPSSCPSARIFTVTSNTMSGAEELPELLLLSAELLSAELRAPSVSMVTSMVRPSLLVVLVVVVVVVPVSNALLLLLLDMPLLLLLVVLVLVVVLPSSSMSMVMSMMLSMAAALPPMVNGNWPPASLAGVCASSCLIS